MALDDAPPPPPSSPTPPPVPPLRRAFFTIVFMICVAILTLPIWSGLFTTQPVLEEAAAETARDRALFFAEKTSLNQVGRVVIGGRELLSGLGGGGGAAQASLLDQLRQSEEQFTSPLARLMLLALYDFTGLEEEAADLRAELLEAENSATAAVVEAAVDGTSGADGAGDGATTAVVDGPEEEESEAADGITGGSSLESSRAAMARLYLEERPIPDERIERLRQQLGFVGRVAAVRNAELAGEEAAAAELRDAIEQDARRFFIGFIIVFAAFLLAISAGTLLLVLFFVFRSRGLLQWHFPPASETPAFLLFETFTLYLAFTLLFGAASTLVQRDSPLSLPITFVVQLLALALIAYPRLAAGVPMDRVRRSVGLSTQRSPLVEVLLGPVGYIGGLPVVVLMIIVVSRIIQFTGTNVAEGMHPIVPIVAAEETPVFQLVMLFVLAVVTAPLVEEIMFRGFFYRFLRSRFGAGISIALSAALFAAIHPQGLIGFPLLLSIGVVLAVLREWRNSLIAPIIAHACVNGVTMTLVQLAF